MERYGGPQTILTPELAQRVVESVEAGNYVETAVKAAGISSAVYYKWIKRGKAERERVAAGGKPKRREEIFWQFADLIDEAESRAEEAIFTQIRSASRETWQAGAWILERKFPAKYGQRIQFTIEQELGSMMAKLQAKLTQAEYERVLEAMASETMGSLPAPPQVLTLGEGGGE